MAWDERPIELIAEMFEQEYGLGGRRFAERLIEFLRIHNYYIVYRPEGDNRPK